VSRAYTPGRRSRVARTPAEYDRRPLSTEFLRGQETTCAAHSLAAASRPAAEPRRGARTASRPDQTALMGRPSCRPIGASAASPHRRLRGPPHRRLRGLPHRRLRGPPHRRLRGPPHRRLRGPPHRRLRGLPHRRLRGLSPPAFLPAFPPAFPPFAFASQLSFPPFPLARVAAFGAARRRNYVREKVAIAASSRT
jgi:hypothetical protein